jgi:hypothetical protein
LMSRIFSVSASRFILGASMINGRDAGYVYYEGSGESAATKRCGQPLKGTPKRLTQASAEVLEIHATRDPEEARGARERIDLTELEGAVEGDLVVELVQQVLTPEFDRPLVVR